MTEGWDAMAEGYWDQMEWQNDGPLQCQDPSCRGVKLPNIFNGFSYQSLYYPRVWENTSPRVVWRDLQNVQTNAMFYVHFLHYVVDNFREREIVKSLL